MEPDKFYHIYNRTNNGETLFKEKANYLFFLTQFKKYISPIAEVYCYCLLANHFHFVLKIHDEKKLSTLFHEKLSKAKNKDPDLQGFQNLGGLNLVSQQFSNLFNLYTKAINRRYQRNGSLFTPNFKRKEINSQEYLLQVILYVHLNPYLHGITDNFEDYKYSSYQGILSIGATELNRDRVIEIFEDRTNFIAVHRNRKVNEEILRTIISEE